MNFRTLEWGKYAQQFASFVGRQIFGRSISFTYGCTTDHDGGGEDPSTGTPANIFIVMNETGNTNSKWMLFQWLMDDLRAQLTQSPVILGATWSFYRNDQNAATVNYRLRAFRMLVVPDYTDATFNKRDATGPVYWENGNGSDVIPPTPGADHVETPFWSENFSVVYGDPPVQGSPDMVMDITSEIRDALLSGGDWHILLRNEIYSSKIADIYKGFCWDKTGYYPWMTIQHLYSVEYFDAANDGTIDLESMAIDTGDLADWLYFGAIQAGDTSTPVKFFAKNMLTSDFELVEHWDDYPEATDPVKSVGSGPGTLNYVIPLEAAVSQRYTVKMTSETEFEVRAQAYRNYTTDLHGTFDADPDWEGSVDVDWSAPVDSASKLTIPTKCWNPDGLTAGDEFTVLVVGNTTNTTWAADSNDQFQITYDDGGNAPDNDLWRPVCGQRTKLRAAVTIDAATKKLYVKPIVGTLWPVGTRCWVGDADNVDEGAIKSVAEAAIGAATQTGTGDDDITVEGSYIGEEEENLYIEIDAEGTPDTFSWGRGSSYAAVSADWVAAGGATGVAVVSGAGNRIDLGDGVYVYWGGTDNHTLGDYWTIPLTPFYIEVEDLSVTSNAYAVGSRVGTTLVFQDVAGAVRGLTNADSGVSEGQPQRIYMDEPAELGFTEGSTVAIGALDGNETNTRVIAAGGVQSSYLELTANLSYDFPSGSFVLQAGGETPIWGRVVSQVTSVEEIKKFRLAPRT